MKPCDYGAAPAAGASGVGNEFGHVAAIGAAFMRT